MRQLVLTVCVGMVALLLMGFAFLMLTDVPVVQKEIVKPIPTPSGQ